MIVCHCKGVSDREIRRAAREGARSCRDVARGCGAGTGCGGCRPVVQEILTEVAAESAVPAPGPGAPAPAPAAEPARPAVLHLQVAAAR